MSGKSSDATSTVVVDDLDQSIVFSPIGAWQRSNQGQGLTGGTFAFSDTENATAVIHVPQNTTAFSWRGFLRSGPALFSVCIDCTGPGQATLVDGHAWNQKSTNVSTTLFTKTGLPMSGHTITITNLLDPRFGNISQMTIDSFILSDVAAVAASSSSSIIPTSTPSSQPTQTTTEIPMSTSSTAASSPSSVVHTSMSSGSSSSNTGYWSSSNASKKSSNGVVVGTACASVLGLVGVLMLVWWIVRKKHVYGKVSNGGYGRRKVVEDVESPMSGAVKLPPSMDGSNSMIQVTFPSRGEAGLGFIQCPSTTPGSNRSSGDHSPHPRTQTTPSSYNSPSAGTHHTPLPQWGIIPLRLSPSTSSNPSASPNNKETNHVKAHATVSAPPVNDPIADGDSDFDYTTPLPSSEIGTSSFMVPETAQGHESETVKHGQTTVSVPRDDERQRRVEEWVERSDEMSGSSPAREDLASTRGGTRLQQGQSNVSRGWRRL